LIPFLLALLLFLALHSVPALPAIRQRLVGAMGRRGYLIAYSLASLLSLGWVFHAALALDYVELWAPTAWQAWIAIGLVPIALFLLAAGLLSPNPASISFRGYRGKPGAIVAITRHPVLWGFLLWAGSHVLANGDLRGLMLFGVLGLFARMGIFMSERRARRRLGADWKAIARSTSILPFAAILGGRTSLRIDIAMGAGLVIAAALTAWLLMGGHAALFGADPLGLAGA